MVTTSYGADPSDQRTLRRHGNSGNRVNTDPGRPILQAEFDAEQAAALVDEQQLRQQTFGRRLAARRAARAMTQRQLAAEMGVSQSAINTWENGRALPRWPQIRQLASLLGVNPHWLLQPMVDDWTGQLGQDRHDLDPGTDQPGT
jgi:ribosome-binding protein aMBF1 (putative translation factor)